MTTIIPAIDIIDGKCVRLTKGDYESSHVYADDPVDMALRFRDCGCTRLHVVDLDGARSQHIVNYRTLERIASSTDMIIDFGGGIKSDEDAKIAFESGASMITGGSIAVKDPAIFTGWLNRYGNEHIILGADARNGKIATVGWLDESEHDIVPFIGSYVEKGIRYVISTDINVDGTLNGPSIELYKNILTAFPDIYLIASGGVSGITDIKRLDTISVPAVIVGKAIYEGRITLKEIEKMNLN